MFYAGEKHIRQVGCKGMTKGANFSENLKPGGIDPKRVFVYDAFETSRTMKTRLKDLRRRNRLTQGEISKYLNITKAAYGYYETGRNAPTVENLIKLARYFGVATDYLLGLSDFPNGTGTERDAFMFRLGDLSLLDEEDIEEVNAFIEMKVTRKVAKRKREQGYSKIE